MPRSESRISLGIEEIRVERVQGTTEAGVKAEGLAGEDFAGAWDQMYGAKDVGWDANPWVWVVRWGDVSVRKRGWAADSR